MTISDEIKTKLTKATRGEKETKQKRAKMAVMSSTMGYRNGILSPQNLHFPKSMIYPIIGMLNCGGTGFLQTGQKDDGKTIDIFRGIRYMQTFKKLPMTLPKKNMNIVIKVFIVIKSTKVAIRRSTLSFKQKFFLKTFNFCDKPKYKIYFSQFFVFFNMLIIQYLTTL